MVDRNSKILRYNALRQMLGTGILSADKLQISLKLLCFLSREVLAHFVPVHVLV